MAIIKSFNFYSSVWKQQTLSISVCITLGFLKMKVNLEFFMICRATLKLQIVLNTVVTGMHFSYTNIVMLTFNLFDQAQEESNNYNNDRPIIKIAYCNENRVNVLLLCWNFFFYVTHLSSFDNVKWYNACIMRLSIVSDVGVISKVDKLKVTWTQSLSSW